MLPKLLAGKEFLHFGASRTETSSNLGKIVEFFHQQVLVTPQGQRSQPFLVRMLYKTKEEINAELVSCGLKKMDD